MSHIYRTDCICPDCGRRHLAAVDLDIRPPRWANYYDVVCTDCRQIPTADRAAVMSERCRRMRFIGRGAAMRRPSKPKKTVKVAEKCDKDGKPLKRCEWSGCTRKTRQIYRYCYTHYLLSVAGRCPGDH